MVDRSLTNGSLSRLPTQVHLTKSAENGDPMSTVTHNNAPTQFVEADGIRFAYRRFGKQGSTPLLFCHHFMANLDNWDPALTDAFAGTRDVILFDNTGIGATSGQVPATFKQMGIDAAAFVDALGLKQVDIFGFSMGGMVAQEIALERPEILRRLL